MAERESDPVPSTDGQAGGGSEADLSLRDRPIDLIDIARVLGQSASIERLDGVAVRDLRDRLTLIRDSLSYATTVLAADVATLSDAGAKGTPAAPGVADQDLHGVFPSWDEDQPPPAAVDHFDDFDDFDDLDDLDLGIDEGLFSRSDQLLAVHREMAGVDLSSAAAVARTLGLVEEQLAILTEREAAVEARLQQIRAVIIRRYRLAAAPAQDRPA